MGHPKFEIVQKGWGARVPETLIGVGEERVGHSPVFRLFHL